MVDRIGQGGGLAREAIFAAMKAHGREAESIQDSAKELFATRLGEQAAAPAETGSARSVERLDGLGKGLSEVNAAVLEAERLPQDLISGKVTDFHQVSMQIKTADLSLKFALEIRNKLVDAYREVMRMSI